MNIYESAEIYAQHLNMSLEQAEIRLNYFSKAKEEMEASRKCPKCGEHSLAYEGGEWESGISSWVYCENNKIEKVDEEGDKYLDECEYADDVKDEHLFVFEHDFDAVLMMSCSLDINDEQAVLNYIGESWESFVTKDTERLISDSLPI